MQQIAIDNYLASLLFFPLLLFQFPFFFKGLLWFFLFICFFLVFSFTHWMPPLIIVNCKYTFYFTIPILTFYESIKLRDLSKTGYSISITFKRLVVPGLPTGTPAVITKRLPTCTIRCSKAHNLASLKTSSVSVNRATRAGITPHDNVNCRAVH